MFQFKFGLVWFGFILVLRSWLCQMDISQQCNLQTYIYNTKCYQDRGLDYRHHNHHHHLNYHHHNDNHYHNFHHHNDNHYHNHHHHLNYHHRNYNHDQNDKHFFRDHDPTQNHDHNNEHGGEFSLLTISWDREDWEKYCKYRCSCCAIHL